jgi:GH24 family phage-related lysozyme (muramidase)
MEIHQQDLAFIMAHEGYSQKAYSDGGRGRYSIGFGTRATDEHETISIEEAEKRLRDALEHFAEGLEQRLVFAPTPYQQTALLSLVYNLGLAGAQGIIDICNSGQFDKAAEHAKEYVFSDGNKLAALVRRRDSEARLLSRCESGPVVVDNEMNRGEPRTQYARVVHLVEQNASIDKWVEVAKEAYEARSSVTASYDDAGIGDLDDRKVILHGKHEGAEDWFSEHYPGVKVVRDQIPAPDPEKPSIEPTNHVLWGLHGSADACWGHSSEAIPSIPKMVKEAKIEAFKILSTESPDTIGQMRKINPNMHFVVRAMWQPSEHDNTVDDFVQATYQDVKKHYQAGVRMFEIHNEPNLFVEGFNLCWRNGGEFAAFLRRVANEYRRMCPDIQIGWPGLSPGHDMDNVRTAAIPFYEQAVATGVVDECDWIGAHCYFTNYDEMRGDAGHYYRNYVRNDKPILITEFSNPTHGVSSDVKGNQYVLYVNSLDPIVHSAYAFIAAASGNSFPHEVWVDTQIPSIVGSRNGNTT